MKKTEERVTEIINDGGRRLKENPKIQKLIETIEEAANINVRKKKVIGTKGAWVCNHCGSNNITCNFKAVVHGYGKPNQLGVTDVDDIKNAEISHVEDIVTDLYWCERCQKEAKSINELAHWEDDIIEREAVISVDEIKKITRKYPIDLDAMDFADYVKYEKARDEYNLDELLDLYEKYPEDEPYIVGDEEEMPDLFEDSVPNKVIDIVESDYQMNGDKIIDIANRLFKNNK